MKQEAALIFS